MVLVEVKVFESVKDYRSEVGWYWFETSKLDGPFLVVLLASFYAITVPLGLRSNHGFVVLLGIVCFSLCCIFVLWFLACIS